ncbi:DUF3054 domain-containing protein [Quadrisphaera granulorum]|uniref:DUF3054 domain-containing protein n=1 Tax=Quadrisphaera granulorum TaxID=317664 RepID=UPI00319DEF08
MRRAAGPTTSTTPTTTRAGFLLALLADVVLVLVFAAVGRRSHGEADALAGLTHTAWPFLAGLALGWLAVGWWGMTLRRWAPLAVVPAGLAVWAGTLVGGHLLRLVSGQGSAPSFVVVSAVVLAVFLLGWRVAVRGVNALLARLPDGKRASR